MVQRQLEQMQTVVYDHLCGDMERLLARCKERIAVLIGAARTDEVVPIPDIATGINIAANSLPLHAGENVLDVDEALRISFSLTSW